MSLSRLLATGLMVGSSSASATQARKRGDGRIDLALLAHRGDLARNLPEVGLRLEVIAPVALDRHAADQAPGHQFPDRVRDVGARQPERVGDLLGGERPLGEIEQRVDLADRAVDAPLPPMSPQCRMKRSTAAGSLSSGGYFCHNRNI